MSPSAPTSSKKRATKSTSEGSFHLRSKSEPTSCALVAKLGGDVSANAGSLFVRTARHEADAASSKTQSHHLSGH